MLSAIYARMAMFGSTLEQAEIIFLQTAAAADLSRVPCHAFGPGPSGTEHILYALRSKGFGTDAASKQAPLDGFPWLDSTQQRKGAFHFHCCLVLPRSYVPYRRRKSKSSTRGRLVQNLHGVAWKVRLLETRL